MTYPKIGTRPTVELQSAEKTEAGTVAPTVTSETLTANSYPAQRTSPGRP